MLKKVLVVAFVVALTFSFGCKKEESTSIGDAIGDAQKQVEKEAPAAEKEAKEAIEGVTK